MAINWALLDTDAPQKIASAFEQGRVKRARQSALGMLETDPEGAARTMAAVGDVEGYSAFSTLAQRRKEQERRAAIGAQVGSGDFAGARAAAFGGGDFELADQIGKLSKEQREQAKASAEGLAQIGHGLKRLPYEQRKARLMAALPQFQAQGYDPKMIQGFDPTDENIDTAVASAMTLKEQLEATKPIEQDPTKRYIQRDIFGAASQPGALTQTGPAGDGSIPLADGPPPPPPPALSMSGPAGGGFDTFKAALIGQESGGRPGVHGPQTQYGVAKGKMQVLDSTGEAMAQRLGVPWRPDLMSGTTAEAAEYQEQIGTAYAQEAWEAAQGDPRTAAMYYHGGPDRSIWGPKTQRHGDAVVRRMGMTGGGGTSVVAGGGGGDVLPAPPPDGYRVIQEATPAPPEWRDQPGGGQLNIRTGKREAGPTPPKPQDSWVTLTTEDAAAAGYEPGAKIQRNIADNSTRVVYNPDDATKKNASYLHRLMGANGRLNAMASEGRFKPSPRLLISEKNGVFRITTSNPADRRHVQAGKEWLAPVLRKDTGASVTDTEFVYYMDIYIPRPEDTDDVLWAKAQARGTMMESMIGEAGTQYKAQFGRQPKMPKVLGPWVPPRPAPAPPKPKATGGGWKFIP